MESCERQEPRQTNALERILIEKPVNFFEIRSNRVQPVYTSRRNGNKERRAREKHSASRPKRRPQRSRFVLGILALAKTVKGSCLGGSQPKLHQWRPESAFAIIASPNSAPICPSCAAERRPSFQRGYIGGRYMSWLKAIVGGAIGAEALSLVKDYIEKQGGVDAVVKQFKDGGFKRQVESWVSTGKNEAINSIEVGQAIGIENVKKLAASAGVDINKARDLLAEYLPIVIDKATPEGKLPETDATKKSGY
jgi:uncharacterized protein YidB (DUF937 family)